LTAVGTIYSVWGYDYPNTLIEFEQRFSTEFHAE